LLCQRGRCGIDPPDTSFVKDFFRLTLIKQKVGVLLEYMMDFVSLLRMKKVRVIEIPKWGTYLRKQWENNFVDHLSDKEKNSIYLFGEDGFCGYLWHV
jgi:hypothetical protein